MVWGYSWTRMSRREISSLVRWLCLSRREKYQRLRGAELTFTFTEYIGELIYEPTFQSRR